MPVIAIQGKCEVKKKKDLPALDNTAIFENLNDPENKAIKLVTKFPLLLHVLLIFINLCTPQFKKFNHGDILTFN